MGPGSVQLLTRQGKCSHLGPLLRPGGRWVRRRAPVGVRGGGVGPKKQLESFGNNLMAFPSAEVRGFLLEADERLLACLHS